MSPTNPAPERGSFLSSEGLCLRPNLRPAQIVNATMWHLAGRLGLRLADLPWAATTLRPGLSQSALSALESLSVPRTRRTAKQGAVPLGSAPPPSHTPRGQSLSGRPRGSTNANVARRRINLRRAAKLASALFRHPTNANSHRMATPP